MSVLDSSALLAYLRGETGGNVVRDLLKERNAPTYAHAINLAEVFYDVLRAGGIVIAEAAITTLYADGVMERNDMDGAFWRDVAALIAKHRGQRRRLALGDACGLALARREAAEFVSADRHELQTVHDAGDCRIIFIR